MPKGWTSISLPEELLKLVDELVENNNLASKYYKSRTGFIKDAVRRRIDFFLETEEKERK